MTRRKLLFTVLIASLIVVAGCARFIGRPIVGTTTGGASTNAPAPTSTPFPPTAAGTATPEVGYTPPPTRDVIGELVTQAYILVTPAPRSTQPPTTTAMPLTVPPGINRLLTPTATLNPAPGSVIVSEPILIANAVNTADCKIRDVGNCTPTMREGVTVYFTWTFGVRGAGTFDWGQAAVVITRNGQALKWTQTGNGLVRRPPDPEKNESWTLLVGQMAEFRAGLENAQPGYYVARLLMCRLSMAECNQGQGWQNVGGDAINFVVTPKD